MAWQPVSGSSGACISVMRTSCCRFVRRIISWGLLKKESCLGEPPAVPLPPTPCRHSDTLETANLYGSTTAVSATIVSGMYAARSSRSSVHTADSSRLLWSRLRLDVGCSYFLGRTMRE